MVKVEHTKVHYLNRIGNGYSRLPEVLVTDAKLVLVPCVIGIKGLGVVVNDKHYHSILISETEKINLEN